LASNDSLECQIPAGLHVEPTDAAGLVVVAVGFGSPPVLPAQMSYSTFASSFMSGIEAMQAKISVIRQGPALLSVSPKHVSLERRTLHLQAASNVLSDTRVWCHVFGSGSSMMLLAVQIVRAIPTGGRTVRCGEIDFSSWDSAQAWVTLETTNMAIITNRDSLDAMVAVDVISANKSILSLASF